MGLTGTTRKFREKMRRHLFDTAAAASTTMRSERDMSVVVVSVASPPNETFGTCGIINVSAYGVSECGRHGGEDERDSPGQTLQSQDDIGFSFFVLPRFSLSGFSFLSQKSVKPHAYEGEANESCCGDPANRGLCARMKGLKMLAPSRGGGGI